MQPFSFRRREKVQMDKLPLNMIVSEPACREPVPQYPNFEEYLASSSTTSTKTDPVQQEIPVDGLNNCPTNIKYSETEKDCFTPSDEDITFSYREDINYDLNSTVSSELWLNDKSFFSSDRSSVNLESDEDAYLKYPPISSNNHDVPIPPDKPRKLQQTENDILNNRRYKNYVPRVQPFLAVWSPKKKKNVSLSQPNNEANMVDEHLDVQPFFQWSKQKIIGQKRQHAFENTDPIYKMSKKVDNRVELGNVSPVQEQSQNISPEFTWNTRVNTEETNLDSPDITFLYKSFNRLPYSSPVNETNVSFKFLNEELKE